MVSGKTMSFLVLFAILIFFVGVGASHIEDQSEPQGLHLALDHKSGAYTVSVDGDVWFASGDTRIHVNNKWCALSDKTLLIQDPPTSDSGTSNMGEYNMTSLHTTCGNVRVDFNFYQYGTGTILFETEYVTEATGTSIGDADSTISEFPTFDLGTARDAKTIDGPPTRGFYQWSGSGVPGYPVVGPHGEWPTDASKLKVVYGVFKTLLFCTVLRCIPLQISVYINWHAYLSPLSSRYSGLYIAGGLHVSVYPLII